MRNGLMVVLAVAMAGAVAGGQSSAGEPVPTCFGKPADHVLTSGNDDLDLSSETDPQVVVGLGGDDSISGGEGNDRICSGSGIDEVYAEDGNDRVNTAGGRDYASGDDGADLVRGSDDAEKGLITWRAGTPDEGLFGAGLDGGRGPDRILGGDGSDEIQGEAGDDVIRGNAGNDACAGGPGDDDVECEQGIPN